MRIAREKRSSSNTPSIFLIARWHMWKIPAIMRVLCVLLTMRYEDPRICMYRVCIVYTCILMRYVWRSIWGNHASATWYFGNNANTIRYISTLCTQACIIIICRSADWKLLSRSSTLRKWKNDNYVHMSVFIHYLPDNRTMRRLCHRISITMKCDDKHWLWNVRVEDAKNAQIYSWLLELIFWKSFTYSFIGKTCNCTHFAAIYLYDNRFQI